MKTTTFPIQKTLTRGGIAILAVTLLMFGDNQSAKGGSDVTAAPTPTTSSNSHSGVADPGIRSGAAAAGKPMPGMSPNEIAYFQSGLEEFVSSDSVTGKIPGTGAGLGPRYNLDSCGGCHAYPAAGGSSPAVNPQVAAATLNGANNRVPQFIRLDGPVREVRFKQNPDGSPDGGVHDLYTISGMSDARGCNIDQPDFRTAAQNQNLIFRIPTPLFGAGLIESISDSTILANQSANQDQKSALGISGHPNRSGNDGTIARFGWKAQNKSLEIFSGEAYNVEQGVTNELFPNERDETPNCVFNGVPEDQTSFDSTTLPDLLGDIVRFTNFAHYLAPPTPAPATQSTSNGGNQFARVGCALCHSPVLTTGKSSSTALTGRAANLYSDLLLHNMGSGLADGISQGAAGPDEFRTAPLWGLGQRIFFLHDGRTNDLLQAIQAHASNGSEANNVIQRFNALSDSNKQDLLNFLRSL